MARFRRNVVIYDTSASRASTIPISHNYPGFPQEFLEKPFRLRRQLSIYKVPLIHEEVKSLTQLGTKDFVITKNIILATGVKDIEPKLPNINDAIRKGLIRHCPVCDAYEVINKKIGVIGEGQAGLKEALFLLNIPLILL